MRLVGDKGRWILRGLVMNEAGVGLRCANPTYGLAKFSILEMRKCDS